MRRGLPGFGEPFFLFVNLMEAHGPYGRDVSEEGETLAALRQIYLGDDSLIRRRLPWNRRAYARSARFAVERVLELMGALGPRLEDSLVIVTSDHGEAIREDATNHQLYLYDELTRVPLYVRWPACLPAPPEGGGLVSLTKIWSIVSSASGCEVPRVAGGIALSESFGTILAPDERRLGARVSPERLRWVFSHRVKVHTGRGSVTYNASQGIVEEVSGLGAEEAARLAGEAVAWLAGGRGLLLLQMF
ncbi:MAG: sulfatase-like hydrolase/transferase [Nitrososphaeria archaeon]